MNAKPALANATALHPNGRTHESIATRDTVRATLWLASNGDAEASALLARFDAGESVTVSLCGSTITLAPIL